jgi:ribosomal protein S18 acetylase RimI-like enzyme
MTSTDQSKGLNAIVTDPAYQRRGVADMLVGHGCQAAAEEDGEGIEIFSACAKQANENMSKVWEKYGFEIVDREGVEGGLGVVAGLRRGSKE